jgi:hypothetical protein
MGLPAQFRGLQAVIRAYENNAVPSFAILCGKQFLFHWEGSDIEEGKQVLKGWIDLMSEGNQDATATYTLRVYDDLSAKEKIRINRDYSGSFNFKLFDYAGYGEMGLLSRGTASQRIQELDEKLNRLLEEREHEESEEKASMGGIGAMLNGLLEMPEIRAAIAGKVVSLFNNFFPMGPTNVIPQPVGQIAGDSEANELTRLNNILERLFRADPDLINHLGILAEMSEKEPGKFSMLLTMLK